MFNEVTETAHYSASILQDVLGEFRENVQEKYQLSQMEDEQQVQHCIELIEYMNPILEQKILTNLEQNSMIERMESGTGKDQQCGLRKTVCKVDGDSGL